MIYQSVHAPFDKMADIWESGSAAVKAVDELMACLYDCAENDIPIMVVHAFIGFDSHLPNESGLKNFEKVVNRAEGLPVKIAFENIEGEEYLAAIMERFSHYEHVGFCWDTGHEMCYNRSKDMLSLYGDKILCTHINDNLGIKDFNGSITYLDDLHLLPFDGIADWNNIVDRLNEHHYYDILTFELKAQSKPGRHENDVYAKMSIQEYLIEAYKRACRVAALKLRRGI